MILHQTEHNIIIKNKLICFYFVYIIFYLYNTGWSKVNDINWMVISQPQRHLGSSSRKEKFTYIWSTFSRNDFPLKISWCFPKKVFSLVFLGVLIIYAIELGSVSFIKSWVGQWILHNKFVWGCPKYWLNSRVFWYTIRGIKKGCQVTYFYS